LPGVVQSHRLVAGEGAVGVGGGPAVPEKDDGGHDGSLRVTPAPFMIIRAGVASTAQNPVILAST
jgi:hypothetical protein